METNITIPQGQTREEIKKREKIISDFYAKWNESNPEKRVFNNDLQSFIYVRFFSFQETVEKASRNPKSTLAVTYLTEILELAKVVKYVKPKPSTRKQDRFSDVIIMRYDKENFGKIKLIVGILRGSGNKIQYCITAMEK